MAYTRESIEKVIEANDIVDVISDYVELKRAGKEFRGLCPFHREKTPSFMVSPTKQVYHCFGCNASGNVVTFIMDIENLSFKEAIEFLAERAGIPLEEVDLSEEEAKRKKIIEEIYRVNKIAALFFHRKLFSEEGVKALEYLKSRGLSSTTIKKFGIGYAPSNDDLLNFLKGKGYKENFLSKAGLVVYKSGKYYDRFKDRVMFPIIDVRGNVVGFGGRALDDSLPKYLNTPETEIFKKGKTLFAINFAKKTQDDKFIIVEGYMDAISLHQAGIDCAVASLGTALTEDQARLIKRYKKNVVIAYDADEAGVNATLRGLDILEKLNINIKVLSIPEGKDPDEFIKKEGSEAFRRLVENAESLIEFKSKIFKKGFDFEKVEDRIIYVKKIASEIAKISDEVKREVYISAAAKTAQIPENAVRTEVDRFVKRETEKKQKFMYRTGNIRHNIYSSSKISPEKYLIALLLHDNNLYHKIKGVIKPDMLEDSKLKPIFEEIVSSLEGGKQVQIKDIVYLIQEEDNLISDFNDIVKALFEAEDLSQMVDDILQKILLNNLARKREEIRKEILNAHLLGDVEKERELLIKLQNCEKEMLKIKDGQKERNP
ncbi:MAG: DNA primase [Caldanaerobacter subterraneus]|jgi:DNA primase|uniref:DNA primase n=2 Tax=Caldanaerobacter subterraneus TaxID=911092 RepID=Q8R969_CALS4|nr:MULTISPECIES: DNA primase [Caldanaerobacter]AAM24950.1 DNA primase (bacterial type) [Caldanaerobacter subterraneus subsp. tengcongensis MB4]KUK09510.1 MAG: DNA primase [Caldanaerobacter subterraneus]MCS3915470.1 DNA primase [Caldanaerobacter subterraneus subsp. tengcongensis MB4]MDI3519082.1 primase [Caldanaerobacter sp.]HBT49956.1 DNA primase [Caldanaerobacter subterraneus]